MFRIGIIGCGWIVRLSHTPAILKTPEGVITAFYSRTSKSSEITMKEYHRKLKKLLRQSKDEKTRENLKLGLESRVYTDLEEFFKVIDGVDIATSPNTHMQFAKMAAKRGKRIMLEKPTARTLFEVEKVYPSIKNSSLYMYTQRMYDDGIEEGKRIIDSGKLGKIKSFWGSYGNAILIYIHNKKQFWDPRISGGGALLDLGPHIYSVFRNWFGSDYKFESVREIDIGTVKKTRKLFGTKNYKVEVDDKAKIECVFQNSEKGDITVKFDAFWGNKDLYPEKTTRGYYFEVVGENGIMKWFGNQYRIEYNDGSMEEILVKRKVFSTGEENVFRAFIRGEESKNPAWFAREMMIILEGGYISHHLGGKNLTEQEILDFVSQFDHINLCEEKSLAIINTLFPIEK